MSKRPFLTMSTVTIQRTITSSSYHSFANKCANDLCYVLRYLCPPEPLKVHVVDDTYTSFLISVHNNQDFILANIYPLKDTFSFGVISLPEMNWTLEDLDVFMKSICSRHQNFLSSLVSL